jgi:hypothetical protein
VKASASDSISSDALCPRRGGFSANPHVDDWRPDNYNSAGPNLQPQVPDLIVVLFKNLSAHGNQPPLARPSVRYSSGVALAFFDVGNRLILAVDNLCAFRG